VAFLQARLAKKSKRLCVVPIAANAGLLLTLQCGMKIVPRRRKAAFLIFRGRASVEKIPSCGAFAALI
jgi:hypothetical protein